MKRSDFDNWFPSGSMLRELAQRIATLKDSNSPSFLKGPTTDWPDNFLANGELGSVWHKPPTYTLADLAAWKSGCLPLPLSQAEKHGFGNGRAISRRGLAPLFDPFVDSFIAAHVRALKNIPEGCTVIVLSDYFTFCGLGIPLNLTDDWGLTAMRNTMQGIVHSNDQTTKNLFDCLFGKKRWENDEATICREIVNKKVLLWNFLPMFRGGKSATGSGVPPRGPWQIECWDLLREFVAAVRATKVVLMCSQNHIKIPRSSSPLASTGICLPRLGTLSLPSCVLELWRLNHPYSWFRRSECSILSGLI